MLTLIYETRQAGAVRPRGFFYVLPAVVRTYAPRGQTPVLRAPLLYDHLSAISGITPEGKLYMNVQDRAIRGPDVVRFLRHLMRHVEGKLLVIWDGLPAHRSEAVKQFLRGGPAGAFTWSNCRAMRRS